MNQPITDCGSMGSEADLQAQLDAVTKEREIFRSRLSQLEDTGEPGLVARFATLLRERDELRAGLAEAQKELQHINQSPGHTWVELQTVTKERDELLAQIERIQAGEVPNNALYQGNSVWHWWAKAKAYGDMVHGVNPILGAKDGEATKDAAARVIKERDDLRAKLAAAEARVMTAEQWIIKRTKLARQGSWPCYHHVTGGLHAQWREENGQLSKFHSIEEALAIELCNTPQSGETRGQGEGT